MRITHIEINSDDLRILLKWICDKRIILDFENMIATIGTKPETNNTRILENILLKANWAVIEKK